MEALVDTIQGASEYREVYASIMNLDANFPSLGTGISISWIFNRRRTCFGNRYTIGHVIATAIQVSMLAFHSTSGLYSVTRILSGLFERAFA